MVVHRGGLCSARGGPERHTLFENSWADESGGCARRLGCASRVVGHRVQDSARVVGQRGGLCSTPSLTLRVHEDDTTWTCAAAPTPTAPTRSRMAHRASRGVLLELGRVRGGRGLLGVLTASSRVRYRPRPHARTRSFLMARSGPGDAARNRVVRRLRAATRSRFASDAHPARRCATATMRTWEIRRRTLTIASVDAGHIPNGVTGDERCGPCPTWERRRHRGEFRGAIEPAALTHFCSGISPDYTASSGLRWRIVKEGLR